ncbi:preprotein translocase subunit SecE [Chakrabartyella piscis]|uniref:preprotein translocase subunit SecE n=1 Tax=Chakrabartyella piscis TaxID=2918914 RepID=UPI002958591F|nr:preprotein translocase subunit SecE [Chakrabartyella piscis]
MEENKNTSTNQTSANKKVEAKKTKKNDGKDSFADYKAEFKKIVWPDRPEVIQKTFTVIVTSLLIGAIIFCMDTVFSTAYNGIIGLLG